MLPWLDRLVRKRHPEEWRAKEAEAEREAAREREREVAAAWLAAERNR